MKDAHDAVGGVLFRAGRRPHAETADVHRDRSLHHAGEGLARDDEAGIGTALARRILDVLPDQRAAAGHGVNTEKQQRHGRFSGQLFQMHVGAVVFQVVDTHEPGILRVGDREFAFAFLKGRMTQRHVVGDGVEFATARDFQVTLLAGDQILAQQQAAIRLAMGLLEHFTLAAAARALVHDGHHVVIRRNDLDRGTMVRHPTLAFAQAEQHAIDALLGARSGIQIVREQFVQTVAAIMHDDLFAVAMRVPEDRCHVNDRARHEARRNLVVGNDALQHDQTEREESGIGRRNHQGVQAYARAPSNEAEQRQFLALEPLEGLLAQRRELGPKALLERFLVGGQPVANHHAVRVAAAHVRIRVVGSHTVAHPRHGGFDDATFARNVVGDFKVIRRGAATGQGNEFIGRAGDGEAFAVAENLRRFGGGMVFLPVHVCLWVLKNWIQANDRPIAANRP